ncbi:MAG TPA: ribonuclease III domain-containing protein [Lachnospiraceae bacterium]|nr:ribonuclease III domain-containing protein [Lachnospiraceae bacterium]
MEESLNQFLPGMSPEEAKAYSPLVLAFLGDAVYELHIRTMLVKHGNSRPNALHHASSEIVKAQAQSEAMDFLQPVLTREEEEIYRRGRNAKSYTTAKNATVGDYRRATGFEALIGYLYLTGQEERMLTLIRMGVEKNV